MQVQDLEAEKQGVQEAVRAALLMMSERCSHNPASSPAQHARSNTVLANEPDIVTPRLESVAVSNQVVLVVVLGPCARAGCSCVCVAAAASRINAAL